VVWASSDNSVATVSNGKVTAVKAGTTTIKATCGGKTAECAVTVIVPVSSITLDKTVLSLTVGESATLSATVKPDNATDKNVVWTSSDNSVATVSNGKVTAVKAGTATVKATCGGKTAECAVTVTVPTGSITLDKTVLSLAVGESATLTATVKPDNATDKNVVWTSSDNTVVTVSDGKVTAVKAGTATVKATCGGKTAECVVTVTVPVSSVTLDKTMLSLTVGESATLSATVKPDNATDKNVVWTSSDNSVATVSNGKVTAVKAGTATVKATCGGKTAECVVTVIVPVSSISLNKTILTIGLGETETLSVIVKPDNATDKTVKWASSDETVITVNSGEIYAKKEGIASISATVGNKTATCSVEVIRRDNVIYYTSSTSSRISLDSRADFGAEVVSNEWANGLGKITLSGPATQIGSYSFFENGTLRTIYIPKTVKQIGDYAFYKCFALNTINCPESISVIGQGAFYWCALKTFYVPDNVQVIAKETFAYCKYLESIRLPETLTTVCDEAFDSCNQLVFTIPASVSYIGRGAFSFTLGPDNLIIPDKTTVTHHSFSYCKMKTVELPEGMKSIPNYLFANCTNLKIAYLPSTITEIGSYSFESCISLQNVYVKAVTPPNLNKYAFEDCLQFQIWVPSGSVEAYKAASVWKDFADRIKGYDY
jgi:uncharacterized protein YjdB